MKYFNRVLLWALFGIAMPTMSYGQTTLYSESFETDGEGSRYTSTGYASGCDFFMRSSDNPPSCHSDALTGRDGSFAWISEDIISPSHPVSSSAPGILTSSSFSVSGFQNIEISLLLAISKDDGTRWEFADSINIQFSMDGGTFRTVGRFGGTGAFGGDIRLDNDLDGVPEGASAKLTTTYTNHTFTVPTTGSNMQVRLDFDQNGGSEELSFDLIRVTGDVLTPVVWSSFTGESAEDGVQLNWETTSEINNQQFVVERDAGTGFAAVATIPAQGIAAGYEFLDSQAAPGANRYRIRQVDFDQQYSFSEVITVHHAPDVHTLIYPNPFTDLFTIAWTAGSKSGTARLYDISGKRLWTASFEEANSFVCEKAGLLPGLYFLEIEFAGGAVERKKLIRRP